MTQPFDLAIVILNWNGKSFLEQHLPSVIQHSDSYRIVVVDNASTDDSIPFLKLNYPQIEIIVNEQNGGFAKGYNDGLKQVESEFYLLLNSDVEVTEGWLNPMIEAMKNPKIAGCQPKIKAYHRPDYFEHAGASGGFIDKYYFPFCRGRIFNSIEQDTGQYDYSMSVFWATGACMLIRSELYWKAGGLDERFFAHMEEIDLCWRIQRMGFEFKVEPQSSVYHVGGGTLNYESPRKTFLNFRNSLLMIHKNHDRNVYWLLFRRMGLDGIAAFLFLFKGQFPHFWAVAKAHYSFYRLLPSSIQERKKYKHLKYPELKGQLKGSILIAKFFRGINEFSQLNHRKF